MVVMTVVRPVTALPARAPVMVEDADPTVVAAFTAMSCKTTALDSRSISKTTNSTEKNALVSYSRGGMEAV